MIFKNLIFQAEVIEQRFRAGLVPHHEQQASKWNGEKQHRELWPAYNPNIAPPQASTEGLFQQTRLFTTVIILQRKRGLRMAVLRIVALIVLMSVLVSAQSLSVTIT